MAADGFILIIVPILIVSNVICDYSIKYESVESCQLVREQNEYNYYFDTAQLKCEKCIQKKEIQVTSIDGYSCKCTSHYKYKHVFGNGKVMCELCPNNQTASEDGWHCILDATKCASCPTDSIKVQREINGSLLRNSQNEAICDCVKCTGDTIPNASQDKCIICTEILYSSLTANCSCMAPLKSAYNTCVAEILSNPVFTIQLVNGESPESNFLKNNLPKAYGQCKVTLSRQKACQTLGNMCVLLYYNYEGRRQKNMNQACQLFRSLSTLAQRRYAVDDWPQNMPWLYYDKRASNILKNNEMQTIFTVRPPMQMKFIVAKYSAKGDFLGMHNVTGGVLQLCKMSQRKMDAVWFFGNFYKSTCELSVNDLFDTEKYPLEFYDLYLEYSSNGKYLQAVPVLIENYLGESDARENLGNIDNWLLTRRFFLVDNVATKNTLSPDRAEYLRYASSITLVIQLQPEKDGNIFTPYLKISYAEVHSDDANVNGKVQVSFQSEYIQNEANIQRNIDTAIGTLSGLGVLWACLNTWIWSKRAGRIAIDFATLINLLFNVCASLSNIFFINILGIGLYFLVFFKRQDIVVIMPLLGSSLTKTYASYIVIAFVFKLFDLLYLMFRQCTIDIFFIDWERPTRQQKDAPISAWRTLFAANEWNEIQTIRRTHTSFQLMIVIYFLIVVGFENLSKNNPSLSLTADETDLFIPQNLMFRFTLASTIYLIVAFCQWLFMIVFYERFIEDKVQQYVDLCSISNISLFIMDHLLFGYYIHGKSVHRQADTDFKNLLEMMRREEEDLCSHRGLLPNTEQQTFQMSLTRKLRLKYCQIMQPINQQQHTQTTNRMENGGATGNLETLQAYHNMNKYLSAFIEHSIKDVDYLVKDKTFLENVMDAEFVETLGQSIFYHDNGHSFDKVLFYGHEMTLLIFEILLFNIIDLIWQNFVLDGILTYIIIKLIIIIRNGAGRKNLAKKTLVDKRFLI